MFLYEAALFTVSMLLVGYQAQQMKKDFDTINEMSAVYNRCVVDAYIVDIKALEEK